MKTNELTGATLDYWVAKCDGRVLRTPEPSTYEDLAKLQTPFKLYGTTCTISGGKSRWKVEEVTITRVGIYQTVGATAPSVSFIDDKGIMCLGSASLFYLTREDAQVDADMENFGGLEGFAPSTDWSQGGPIIEREGMHIDCLRMADHYRPAIWEAWPYKTGTKDIQQGPTPLIAAMRCYVASKFGDEVTE